MTTPRHDASQRHDACDDIARDARHALERLGARAWELDILGEPTVRWMSSALAGATGFPGDAPASLLDRIPAEDVATVLEAARSVAPSTLAHRLRFVTGETLRVQATFLGSEAATASRRFVAFSAAKEDADDAIQRRLLFFESVLENIPDMVFVKDARDLRFVCFNRAGERILGMPRDELLGRNDYDFFPREQADFFTRMDREVLASGELVDVPEEPIETRLGTRLLHTKKIPLRDSNGEPAFLLGISEDITHRRRAEEAAARAEETSRTRAQVLQTVSHELLTPLTAIRLCLDVLCRAAPDLPERARAAVERMSGPTARLTSMIETLMEHVRMEHRRGALTLEDVDVLKLCEGVVEGLRTIAEAKHVDVRATANGDGTTTLRTDRKLLELVVQNLAGNALKFTERGQVLVAVAPSADGCTITVEDTGPGVPSEVRERIFEPFARFDTGGRPGLGLGLAIAREAARRVGGTVTLASSTLGKGSTFTLSVPRLLACPA